MRTRPAFVMASALLLGVLGCREDSGLPTESETITPAVPALAVVSNSWITRADMPSTERWGLTTATLTNAAGQSVLYAIAGRTVDGTISRVQAYNASTNTWTWKAPLPVAAYEMNGAAVINGKIYVSGGIMAYKSYSDRLYVYNATTNTWTRKRDVPNPGYSGFTGVIGNKLYVVTSCHDQYEDCFYWPNDNHPDVWLFRYNPATDTWSELAIPPRRFGLAQIVGGTIGQKLYIGLAGSSILDIYDPVTNTWTQKTTGRSIRPGASFVTLSAKLYMIGGFRRNADHTITELATTSVYDPATNLWGNKAAMPTPRSNVAAGRVTMSGQTRIEVVGGRRPGNNQQYIP